MRKRSKHSEVFLCNREKLNEEIAALYAERKTISQIAAALGKSYPTISRRIKEQQFAAPAPLILPIRTQKPRKQRPAHEIVACLVRDAEMATAYRSGQTLQEIGTRHGISRERVRQRLALLGLSAEEGGIAFQRLKRIPDRVAARRAREAELEAKCYRRWGCDRAMWRSIGAKGRRAYVEQRRSAGARGIVWGMTLGEWWTLWQQSGRWLERGRGPGYCMARIADDGPYAAWNVEIITNSQNIKDSYVFKPAHLRPGNIARRLAREAARV